jgi:hypothetical protein
MEPDFPDKMWKRLTLIVTAILILAPVAYLALVYIWPANEHLVAEPSQVILYLLYVIALIDPAKSFIVKRASIAKIRGTRPPSEYVSKRFEALVIIRCASVGAVYLYGLLWFILSGQTSQLYFFYAIGVLWSLMRWPRKQEYFDFVQEAKAL